jgi:hypothetical protein
MTCLRNTLDKMRADGLLIGSSRFFEEMSLPCRFPLCLVWLCLLASPPVTAGEAQPYRDPDTGLMSWRMQQPEFSLQLVQMLPDYVAAVYSSRGLPPALIERMRTHCVFGTILTNDSDATLTYRVADWHAVTTDGTVHPFRGKSAWVAEWAAMGVGFRWSMLADEQTFAPGDWMQGFTTVELAPGSTFDFDFSVTLGDNKHDGRMAGVRCAPAQPS